MGELHFGSKVGPILSETLTALESDSSAADPTRDPSFMAKRSSLAAILGSAARNTKAAFENDWGPAVMFALSGHHGVADLDVGWGGVLKHFE